MLDIVRNEADAIESSMRKRKQGFENFVARRTETNKKIQGLLIERDNDLAAYLEERMTQDDRIRNNMNAMRDALSHYRDTHTDMRAQDRNSLAELQAAFLKMLADFKE